MTLRARLALGIFVIGAILLVPLLLAIGDMRQLEQQTLALKEKDFAAAQLLSRMRGATDAFVAQEVAMGVDTTDASYQRAEAELARMTALTDSLGRFALDGRQGPIAATLASLRQLVASEREALRLGRTSRADSISAFAVRPVIARLTQELRRSEEGLAQSTELRVSAAAVAVAEMQQRTATAFALAAALAVVVAAALTYTISRPVRDLEEGMRRVADGDFGHELRIPKDRHDEFGRLAASYDTMTQQLATLDRLKAEFISVASHELKTPINVILGYLQLLQEGVYGDLSPKQREIATILETQSKTLTRLTRHLLDIGRFEAGGGRLELRTLSLRDFLEDLERAFAVLARQRDVRLLVTRAADAPPQVVWDPDRMNEVLGNLLSNAFKFTGRGGRVELAVSRTGDDVRIVVRDTGAGISSEQLPRIFEKFFQADNQSQAAAKGSGLGLAIVKSIVEAHGGHIGCESAPGVGTTFEVVLPVRATQRRAPAQTSDGTAVASGTGGTSSVGGATPADASGARAPASVPAVAGAER